MSSINMIQLLILLVSSTVHQALGMELAHSIEDSAENECDADSRPAVVAVDVSQYKQGLGDSPRHRRPPRPHCCVQSECVLCSLVSSSEPAAPREPLGLLRSEAVSVPASDIPHILVVGLSCVWASIIG